MLVVTCNHGFPLYEAHDQGFNKAFDMNDEGVLKSKYKGFRKDIYYHIKAIIIEIFEPELVMSDYNSKVATNMVGIENLGATCYLNSLLQMLYHINAFRKAVYSLPHDNEVNSNSTTLALQHVFRQLQTSSREIHTKVYIVLILTDCDISLCILYYVRIY